MGKDFVHQTAVLKNTKYASLRCYRNTYVVDSNLGDGVSIGDDTTIERCSFEQNVIINRRSYVNDTQIGAFSYAGINTTINWTKLGRFCSLGRNVDIGGFDHDYKHITTMPEFRFMQMCGNGIMTEAPVYGEYCMVGNDVWIAAGAQVLHKVKVGDGAVIGAGAVVTHDVPPYAIVVGVPAKVIGFRCDKKLIDALLDIQWWEWPIDLIKQHMDMFIKKDISQETIELMRGVASNIQRPEKG